MRWGSKAKNDDIRYIIKYTWYPIKKRSEIGIK